MKTPDFHAFARNRSLPLWLLGLVLTSFPAWTEDLDVTANMSLPPGDYEYDALMVRTGATLTLQGDPATGTGVTLRVTGMVVETGATVTATAQGYGAQAGPGAATNDRAGGSHGGRGGGTNPAETYGSAVAPTDLGSGGWSAGGGGSIKLEVADLLQIDGTLSANGEFGGGAGGSIFIETGRIAGGGLLQANGGRGQCGSCSASIPGGGGGRIAIHHAGSTFTGVAEAREGRDNHNAPSGEDGTVGWFDLSDPVKVAFTAGHAWRFQANDATEGEIVLESIRMVDTKATVEDGVTVVLTRAAWVMERTDETQTCTLSPYGASGTLRLAANTLRIGDGCVLATDGNGYEVQSGPGAATNDRAGGSHGGRGGGTRPAPAHGSAFAPTDLGSGGWDGAGGGRIRIEVVDLLQLDGTLSANGELGGGAGGSIFIETGQIAGGGLLQANGGRGQCGACTASIPGGGGGRIAIHHAGSTFTGVAEARDGRDNHNAASGEDGTVGWFDLSDPQKVAFTAGHAWRFQANDALDGQIALDTIQLLNTAATVEDGVALVRAVGDFTMERRDETATCTLSPYGDTGTLRLAAGSLTVGEGCVITADGKGFGSGMGPGAGASGAGSGHGGQGGGYFGPGGPTYGSERLPIEWGSTSENGGGQGGGAVDLNITGTLLVDGTISANATSATGSGSSGGSVLIRTRHLAGSGLIQANGARSRCSGCSTALGGGGGGRIAILHVDHAFAGTVEALGGVNNFGTPSGKNGTVFWAREQAITLGTPIRIEAQPLVHYGFRLDWPGGDPEVVRVRLVVQSATGDWTLRGAQGEPASQQNANWTGIPVATGADAVFEMLLPLDHAGAWYLDVFNASFDPPSAGDGFTLEVEPVERYVVPAFLGRGGNQGSTSFAIAGAGFEPGMQVAFRTAVGQPLRSFPVSEIDPVSLSLTADLRNLAPELVDVAIIWPDQEEFVLSAAFEITGNPPGKLRITTDLPSSVRALRQYTLWVTCANIGASDLPAPLLRIANDDNIAMRMSTADPFVRGEMYAVAIREIPPYDVIPPGTSVRFRVQFIPEGGSHHETVFRVETLTAEGREIDWEQTKLASHPAGLSDPAWDAIWANFRERMGNSTEDFATRMREDAVYLAQRQNGTPLLARLLGLELAAAADATGAIAPRCARVDLTGTTDAPELAFVRYATDALFSRYESGTLGFGWTHSYDYRLYRVGTDRIRLSLPGRFARRFYLSPLGTWQPFRGDHGRLEETAEGYALHDGRQTMRFDVDGNLTAIESLNGRQLTLLRDAGRLTQVVHSNGETLTLHYDGDLLESVEDSTGRLTRYAYTAGHLTTVTLPDDTTEHYEYQPDGPAEHALAAVTFPDGARREFDHDDWGRLSRQAWSDGDQEVLFHHPETGAVALEDATGRTLRVDFNSDTQPLQLVAPDGNTWSYLYREEERWQRLRLPSGGGSLTLHYDEAGNPTELIDPLGRSIRTAFSPVWSRLQWIEDPLGLRTTMVYDAAGELTAIIHPDGSQMEYERDAGGHATRVTRRGGQVVDYLRDASGRVLQETIVDQATNAFVRGSSGRIEQLIEERGTTAFGRDARDRITSVAYPDGGSLEFTRDAAGRRLQVTDHTGFQVRYAYDSKGRLAAVNDADDVAVVNYTYDAAGRLAQETRRNQTATAYTYDANGRMAEIVHLGPDGQPQERFTYTCDANGKCRSVTDLAGNVTRYTYDAAGRLVHVEYPGGDFERFTYDAADNRLAVSTPGGNTAYTANSFQQYVQVGDQTLTHDPAGSLETDGTRTFTYDGKDRLLSVATTEGDNQDYAYDSLGSRWQASVNGEITRFLNDPSGIGWVFAEMDELGEIRCHQVLGLRPVAWVDASGEWYFYGFDRSGHTRLVTDSAGQVVNRYTYGAFGGEREVVEAVANPCRFGGAWGARTEANGLIFLRHRYYDPALGRFLSPDPIGLAGGLHPFTYAGNDPVNRTDRQGLVEAEDAVDLFFDDPEDVLEDWLIPDPIDIVVDYTVDRVVDLTKLPPQDVQRLQDMNTIGNVGREVLGDDYRLFDQQTREKAEEGLKDTVKDVIKGIYGVLTGDTLLDVVKDSVKDNLKEGLKPVEPDPAPVLDPSIWELAHKPISELVAPGDPNEKDGWGSLGQRGVAVAGEELRYIVYFENDPKIATAPAQEVRITDALSADLDWASFRLTEIAWGDVSLTPPPGTAEFSQRVTVPDHRPDSDLSWWVDVAASVDAQGVAQWSFQTLDPATGDLPEDALAGFLPVNDDSGRGEGHVAFSIRVRPDAAPGTGLSNYATIQFDVENPIETGAVVFTVVAQQSSHIRTAAVTDGLLILEVQDLLPGIAVTVEQTPDLAVWQELQTTVAAEGITTITVPLDTLPPPRFIRVRQPTLEP